MKISRYGYARCPGCLSHVKVDPSNSCPFCGDQLRDAETIGSAAIELLRGSRTALLAIGLAGGVSFAVACGDPEPKNPTPNNENNENIDPGAPSPVYGTLDPGDPDAGSSADSGAEPDEGVTDPGNDYGGFDPGD